MKGLRGLTIGFLGAGTMGRALMRGLLAQDIRRGALLAADPSPAARRAVRQRLRVAVTDENLDVVRRSDVIVLAVKPQQCPELLSRVGPSLTRRHLVISIAAGITLRWLQGRVPRRIPVVRAMPNLPATVGCGFTALAAGRAATSRHRAIARALFGAAGDVVELPERGFDAVTAVSGSGPAYVFFLVQAWEAAARRLGLPSAVAARAIRRTLEGSGRLLQATDDPAAMLMARVASKGGTTQAALRVLARHRVEAHLIEAIQAAARRSRQLSWG